jgi:hypothetical protein
MMNDDLVTQMRERCGLWTGGETRRLMIAAADEIERLRTRLAMKELVRQSEELGLYELDADDGR